MTSPGNRVVRRLFLSLFMPVFFGARVASAFSPSGLQKVLVIPIDLGSTLADLCPNQNLCPADLVKDAPFYKAPRHTAQDWENLLNNYGTRFWQFASYSQSQAQYNVLANPSSQNGWWTPPHAAADYYRNGDVFVDYKTVGFVEDAARGVIDTICITQPLHCSMFGQFDRLPCPARTPRSE
jgi:hypothetical protein